MIMAEVPVVIGLVQVAKGVGLSGRFAPLLSIALGIGGLLVVGLAWQVAVAQGIIVGLVSSGLFSGGRALLTSPDNTEG